MKKKLNKLPTRLFSFKPNGDELLTNKSNQWIGIARIIVLIIASVESVSWGYAASLMGTGKEKYVYAGIAGMFIFLVVWMLDATLITLDTGDSIYDKRIYSYGTDEPQVTPANRIRKIIKEKKLGIAIFVRAFMVGLSIYVTAPFLSSLIFSREIQLSFQKIAGKAIAGDRSAIVRKADSIVYSVQKNIDTKSQLLENEIAGIGKTKIPGDGPEAKVLRDEIAGMKIMLLNIQKAELAELKTFDSLVVQNNYNALRKRFGIDLPQNSMAERSKAIEPILQSSEGKRFERAIQSFLSFLFLSLILLKIFQPRGVRIYQSEALQSAYLEYKTGKFDRWLDVDEKYTGKSPMTPYRFEDFAMHIYPEMAERDKELKKNQNANSDIETLRSKIEELVGINTAEEIRIQPELIRLTESIRTLWPVVEAQQALVVKIKREVALRKTKLSKCRESIQTLNALIKAGNTGVNGVEWGQILTSYLMELKKLDKKEAELGEEMVDFDMELSEAEKSLSSTTSQVSALQTDLGVLTNSRDNYLKKIEDLKKALADLFNTGN